MIKMLIATRNEHKVAEIRAILGDGFRFLTCRDFPNAPITHEDAATFSGNALKKARELASWISQAAPGEQRKPDFVLADDSGLEVDALEGAPGIHSARFAALDIDPVANASDGANNARLLRLLREVPVQNRTARFRCAIALVATRAEQQSLIFEGVCEGRIDFSPRGSGGFGYDPLFLPHGYEISFSELGEVAKNQISHRGRALEKLKAYFATLT